MPKFKEFLEWWKETLGKNGSLTIMGHTFPDAIHAYAFLKSLDDGAQEIMLVVIGFK